MRRGGSSRSLPAAQRKLLITDGVFSMDGDLGPLPALCELAEETGCIMMVDDAHASGVFGRNGRGTIDHFGMHGRVDIQVGTLSKAIGALGGYVAGNRNLIEFLYHRARPFLFSTSHPPAVVAACIAALDVLHRGAGNHGTAVGQHSFLQGRRSHGSGSTPASARARSPRSSPATAPGPTAVGSAVRARGCSPRRSASRPWRATRRASAPSSRPPTRARICSTRSTRLRRSAGKLA